MMIIQIAIQRQASWARKRKDESFATWFLLLQARMLSLEVLIMATTSTFSLRPFIFVRIVMLV